MKKIALSLAVVFIALALSSKVQAEQAEPLFGVVTNAKAKTVEIVVSSSGCTDKSYFSFGLEGNVLTFKRIRRDACKAMPRPHGITYSLEELGIKPGSSFRLGNPISLTEDLF